MPEAFKVFTKELKGLAMDVHLYDENESEINMDSLAKEALIEERKVNSAIRSLTSPREHPSEEEEEPTAANSDETAIAEEEGLSVTDRIGSSLDD